MASRKSSAAPAAEDHLIIDLKEKLYAYCCNEPQHTVFTQEEIFESGIIPGEKNAVLLLDVTQRLCNEKLLKIVRHVSSSAAWMYRSREDAAKYLLLTSEQEMVYSLIDDAGSEGIWSKTIKTRLNMHDTTMRTALKHLETKRLITDMKSVEHLNRKMYIKASLTPSEKATGGAWYTDGELDEGLLFNLSSALYCYIHSKSFYKVRSDAGKSTRAAKRQKIGLGKAPTPAETNFLRDTTLGDPDLHIKQEKPTESWVDNATGQVHWVVNFDNMLPFPAGYQRYPTLSQLTLFVENGHITPSTLTRDDVEQLLEVLCFDGKIEKVKCGDSIAYKALRKTNAEIEEEIGPVNGLTEAPCGRCPVFDLCEEGGPVGPSNCEYFKTWLGLDGWW